MLRQAASCFHLLGAWWGSDRSSLQGGNGARVLRLLLARVRASSKGLRRELPKAPSNPGSTQYCHDEIPSPSPRFSTFILPAAPLIVSTFLAGVGSSTAKGSVTQRQVPGHSSAVHPCPFLIGGSKNEMPSYLGIPGLEPMSGEALGAFRERRYLLAAETCDCGSYGTRPWRVPCGSSQALQEWQRNEPWG